MRFLLVLMLVLFVSGCVSPPETTTTTLASTTTITTTISSTTSTTPATTTSTSTTSTITSTSTSTTSTTTSTSTTTTTPPAEDDEDVDCPQYDGKKTECIKHSICRWMSGERLCESIHEIEDDEDEFSENWQNMVVDDGGWVGIDPSVATDDEGRPYISYYDQGGRDLKIAWWDGTKWNKKTVDSGGDVGEESGIAVDKAGNPHVSYIDVTVGSLKYAKKTGGMWSTMVVDRASRGYHPVSTSIALDTGGRPHIGYSMESNDDNGGGPGKVKYARWDGSTWQVETVTKGGSDVYIALGSNDKPHLSFKKEDDGGGRERIYYANKISGRWSIGKPDKSTRAGGDTGIAVDSQDRPHIVYNDYGRGAVKYATWDGRSWTTKTVAEKTGKGEGVKIAVDAGDRPNIIYSDDNKEKLVYAVWDGKTWTRETVDWMGNPAIVVDHLGRVHVAHNRVKEGNPRDFCPDYEGDETEIEILKYSVRGSTD